MFDTGVFIGADDVVNIVFAGGNAGEMGGRFEGGFFDQAGNCCVGALTGGAASAVSDRDKFRGQGGEPFDALP